MRSLSLEPGHAGPLVYSSFLDAKGRVSTVTAVHFLFVSQFSACVVPASNPHTQLYLSRKTMVSESNCQCRKRKESLVGLASLSASAGGGLGLCVSCLSSCLGKSSAKTGRHPLPRGHRVPPGWAGHFLGRSGLLRHFPTGPSFFKKILSFNYSGHTIL